MDPLLWLGLFLPLGGFLGILLSSDRISRDLVGIFACTSVLLSFVCFSSLFFFYGQPKTVLLFPWLPFPGINADFSLHLDGLSLLMALVITGVGFLIHLYSIGYVDHEEDFSRYFACLNFFVFSMLLLVLASNLLLLFVGWEGVGLASYLLIGFWYQRPAAAQAATKAFVVNRIGDLGLVLGLLLTFLLWGTSDIAALNERVPQEFSQGAPILTLLTLLYFCGAVGKSAQLPLHVWLPDAMEGPTPVSALIHAATMVTAGVYLVVRLHPIFDWAPLTMQLVGWVGGITALFAALCAMAQRDLKRVLAYSTISQLGYMFLACGVGAYQVALFHLTMHAFVKALLFLSAGVVVHMSGGITDMEKMGGLRKQLPYTHALFLIGALSLAGMPPLAAFFSKDLILEQEFQAGYYPLFGIAIFTSLLTAFYLTRAYCLTFTGLFRGDKPIREGPAVMLWPVGLLGLLSLVGGILGCLQEPALCQDLHLGFVTLLSIGALLLGIAGALLLYPDQISRSLSLLSQAFYLDQLYEIALVKPLNRLSRLIANRSEPLLIDGSLRGAVHSVQQLSAYLQRFQSGQIRSYVAWIAAGAVLLLVWLHG